MKELVIIGIGLLVLWYLSDPEPVAVIDRVPVASVAVDWDGVSIRAGF